MLIVLWVKFKLACIMTVAKKITHSDFGLAALGKLPVSKLLTYQDVLRAFATNSTSYYYKVTSLLVCLRYLIF